MVKIIPENPGRFFSNFLAFQTVFRLKFLFPFSQFFSKFFDIFSQNFLSEFYSGIFLDFSAKFGFSKTDFRQKIDFRKLIFNKSRKFGM